MTANAGAASPTADLEDQWRKLRHQLATVEKRILAADQSPVALHELSDSAMYFIFPDVETRITWGVTRSLSVAEAQRHSDSAATRSQTLDPINATEENSGNRKMKSSSGGDDDDAEEEADASSARQNSGWPAVRGLTTIVVNKPCMIRCGNYMTNRANSLTEMSSTSAGSSGVDASTTTHTQGELSGSPGSPTMANNNNSGEKRPQRRHSLVPMLVDRASSYRTSFADPLVIVANAPLAMVGLRFCTHVQVVGPAPVSFIRCHFATRPLRMRCEELLTAPGVDVSQTTPATAPHDSSGGSPQQKAEDFSRRLLYLISPWQDAHGSTTAFTSASTPHRPPFSLSVPDKSHGRRSSNGGDGRHPPSPPPAPSLPVEVTASEHFHLSALDVSGSARVLLCQCEIAGGLGGTGLCVRDTAAVSAKDCGFQGSTLTWAAIEVQDKSYVDVDYGTITGVLGCGVLARGGSRVVINNSLLVRCGVAGIIGLENANVELLNTGIELTASGTNMTLSGKCFCHADMCTFRALQPTVAQPISTGDTQDVHSPLSVVTGDGSSLTDSLGENPAPMGAVFSPRGNTTTTAVLASLLKRGITEAMACAPTLSEPPAAAAATSAPTTTKADGAGTDTLEQVPSTTFRSPSPLAPALLSTTQSVIICDGAAFESVNCEYVCEQIAEARKREAEEDEDEEDDAQSQENSDSDDLVGTGMPSETFTFPPVPLPSPLAVVEGLRQHYIAARHTLAAYTTLVRRQFTGAQLIRFEACLFSRPVRPWTLAREDSSCAAKMATTEIRATPAHVVAALAGTGESMMNTPEGHGLGASTATSGTGVSFVSLAASVPTATRSTKAKWYRLEDAAWCLPLSLLAFGAQPAIMPNATCHLVLRDRAVVYLATNVLELRHRILPLAGAALPEANTGSTLGGVATAARFAPYACIAVLLDYMPFYSFPRGLFKETDKTPIFSSLQPHPTRAAAAAPRPAESADGSSSSTPSSSAQLSQAASNAQQASHSWCTLLTESNVLRYCGGGGGSSPFTAAGPRGVGDSHGSYADSEMSVASASGGSAIMMDPSVGCSWGLVAATTVTLLKRCPRAIPRAAAEEVAVMESLENWAKRNCAHWSRVELLCDSARSQSRQAQSTSLSLCEVPADVQHTRNNGNVFVNLDAPNMDMMHAAEHHVATSLEMYLDLVPSVPLGLTYCAAPVNVAENLGRSVAAQPISNLILNAQTTQRLTLASSTSSSAASSFVSGEDTAPLSSGARRAPRRDVASFDDSPESELIPMESTYEITTAPSPVEPPQRPASSAITNTNTGAVTTEELTQSQQKPKSQQEPAETQEAPSLAPLTQFSVKTESELDGKNSAPAKQKNGLPTTTLSHELVEDYRMAYIEDPYAQSDVASLTPSSMPSSQSGPRNDREKATGLMREFTSETLNPQLPVALRTPSTHPSSENASEAAATPTHQAPSSSQDQASLHSPHHNDTDVAATTDLEDAVIDDVANASALSDTPSVPYTHTRTQGPLPPLNSPCHAAEDAAPSDSASSNPKGEPPTNQDDDDGVALSGLHLPTRADAAAQPTNNADVTDNAQDEADRVEPAHTSATAAAADAATTTGDTHTNVVEGGESAPAAPEGAPDAVPILSAEEVDKDEAKQVSRHSDYTDAPWVQHRDENHLVPVSAPSWSADKEEREAREEDISTAISEHLTASADAAVPEEKIDSEAVEDVVEGAPDTPASDVVPAAAEEKAASASDKAEEAEYEEDVKVPEVPQVPPTTEVDANENDDADAAEASTVVTTHTKVFDGEWTSVVMHKPETLRKAFRLDVSEACGLSSADIVDCTFALGSLHATAVLRHGPSLTADAIDACFAEYDFPLTTSLVANPRASPPPPPAVMDVPPNSAALPERAVGETGEARHITNQTTTEESTVNLSELPEDEDEGEDENEDAMATPPRTNGLIVTYQTEPELRAEMMAGSASEVHSPIVGGDSQLEVLPEVIRTQPPSCPTVETANAIALTPSQRTHRSPSIHTDSETTSADTNADREGDAAEAEGDALPTRPPGASAAQLAATITDEIHEDAPPMNRSDVAHTTAATMHASSSSASSSSHPPPDVVEASSSSGGGGANAVGVDMTSHIPRITVVVVPASDPAIQRTMAVSTEREQTRVNTTISDEDVAPSLHEQGNDTISSEKNDDKEEEQSKSRSRTHSNLAPSSCESSPTPAHSVEEDISTAISEHLTASADAAVPEEKIDSEAVEDVVEGAPDTPASDVVPAAAEEKAASASDKPEEAEYEEDVKVPEVPQVPPTTEVDANESDDADAAEASTVVTTHTKVFDGEWTSVVMHKPETLRKAFRLDVSEACGLSSADIVDCTFALGSLHATAVLRHGPSLTVDAIDACFAEYDFPLTTSLVANPRASPPPPPAVMDVPPNSAVPEATHTSVLPLRPAKRWSESSELLESGAEEDEHELTHNGAEEHTKVAAQAPRAPEDTQAHGGGPTMSSSPVGTSLKASEVEDTFPVETAVVHHPPSHTGSGSSEHRHVPVSTPHDHAALTRQPLATARHAGPAAEPIEAPTAQPTMDAWSESNTEEEEEEYEEEEEEYEEEEYEEEEESMSASAPAPPPHYSDVSHPQPQAAAPPLPADNTDTVNELRDAVRTLHELFVMQQRTQEAMASVLMRQSETHEEKLAAAAAAAALAALEEREAHRLAALPPPPTYSSKIAPPNTTTTAMLSDDSSTESESSSSSHDASSSAAADETDDSYDSGDESGHSPHDNREDDAMQHRYNERREGGARPQSNKTPIRVMLYKGARRADHDDDDDNTTTGHRLVRRRIKQRAKTTGRHHRTHRHAHSSHKHRKGDRDGRGEISGSRDYSSYSSSSASSRSHSATSIPSSLDQITPIAHVAEDAYTPVPNSAVGKLLLSKQVHDQPREQTSDRRSTSLHELHAADDSDTLREDDDGATLTAPQPQPAPPPRRSSRSRRPSASVLRETVAAARRATSSPSPYSEATGIADPILYQLEAIATERSRQWSVQLIRQLLRANLDPHDYLANTAAAGYSTGGADALTHQAPHSSWLDPRAAAASPLPVAPSDVSATRNPYLASANTTTATATSTRPKAHATRRGQRRRPRSAVRTSRGPSSSRLAASMPAPVRAIPVVAYAVNTPLPEPTGPIDLSGHTLPPVGATTTTTVYVPEAGAPLGTQLYAVPAGSPPPRLGPRPPRRPASAQRRLRGARSMDTVSSSLPQPQEQVLRYYITPVAPSLPSRSHSRRPDSAAVVPRRPHRPTRPATAGAARPAAPRHARPPSAARPRGADLHDEFLNSLYAQDAWRSFWEQTTASDRARRRLSPHQQDRQVDRLYTQPILLGMQRDLMRERAVQDGCTFTPSINETHQLGRASGHKGRSGATKARGARPGASRRGRRSAKSARTKSAIKTEASLHASRTNQQAQPPQGTASAPRDSAAQNNAPRTSSSGVSSDNEDGGW